MKKILIVFAFFFAASNASAQGYYWLKENFTSFLSGNCNQYISNSESIINKLNGSERKEALAIVDFFKTISNCQNGVGCTVQNFRIAIILLNFRVAAIAQSNSCVTVYEIQIGNKYYKVAANPNNCDILVKAEISYANGNSNYKQQFDFGVFEGRISVIDSKSSNTRANILITNCRKVNTNF